MPEVKGDEYQITHEQFIEGVTEVIEITKESLEICKKAYERTKNPLRKTDLEEYAEILVSLIRLLDTYNFKIANGIELQPIVVFTDGKALFGYRGKRDAEFSKKWYDIIVSKDNHKLMVS